MKWIKRLLVLMLIGAVLMEGWAMLKPLPEGLAYAGERVSADQVEFLYDLTYKSEEGERTREQRIFQKVFQMIDEAQSFIVLDFFLFNDDYDRAMQFDGLAQSLTDHLVKALRERPVRVVFITDEINTFYGVYGNPYLEQLEQAGAEIVITDLSALRDSNPIYSALYRLGPKPFGVSRQGTIQNPFSPDSPKVSLSGMLRMMNFKANHRKLVITEKGVLAASANPHDASSNHSNIALYAEAPQLVTDALESEQAVIALSGSPLDLTVFKPVPGTMGPSGETTVQLVTERAILDGMLGALTACGSGDRVDIGVFYLSHRGLMKALLSAASRGAEIRVVLDPNKDAFGRQKNGIPNRQTARELAQASKGKIQVRWYMTQGEQFHSKMMLIRHGETAVLFGGSCNFTRRNFENLNLEANLVVRGPLQSPAFTTAGQWFDRIWNNERGYYTGDLEAYEDPSLWKGALYRFMEATGLCTF